MSSTVLSLLTAGLAAVAALLGVVLGNYLQSRREAGNYARQREDQRQRDNALWSREDRQRFSNERRDVYASFMMGVGTQIREIEQLAWLLDQERSRRISTGTAPIENTYAWISEQQLDQPLSASDAEFYPAYNQLRLIAPLNIEAQAKQIALDLNQVREDLFRNATDPILDPSILDQLVSSGSELRKLMRADLGTHVDRPSTSELVRD